MQIKEKALSTEELAKFSYKEFKKLNKQLIETEAGSCRSSNLSVSVKHSNYCNSIWKVEWTFRESRSKTFKSFEKTWRRLLQCLSKPYGCCLKRTGLSKGENWGAGKKRKKRFRGHYLVQGRKAVDVWTTLPPALWLQRSWQIRKEVCLRYQRAPGKWG